MQFVFTPPADRAAGLLTLPWSQPLAEWRDERLARREYQLLRAMTELGIAVVEVVGVAARRGAPGQPALDAAVPQPPEGTHAPFRRRGWYRPPSL